MQPNRQDDHAGEAFVVPHHAVVVVVVVIGGVDERHRGEAVEQRFECVPDVHCTVPAPLATTRKRVAPSRRRCCCWCC